MNMWFVRRAFLLSPLVACLTACGAIVRPSAAADAQDVVAAKPIAAAGSLRGEFTDYTDCEPRHVTQLEKSLLLGYSGTLEQSGTRAVVWTSSFYELKATSPSSADPVTLGIGRNKLVILIANDGNAVARALPNDEYIKIERLTHELSTADNGKFKVIDFPDLNDPYKLGGIKIHVNVNDTPQTRFAYFIPLRHVASASTW
jgi:hypothetical protein